MSKNITSLFCRNITHNILQKYHKYHEYLPYDVTNIIDALMLPEGALGNGICTVVAQEGPQLGRIYMIYEPNLFKPDTYVQKLKYTFEQNVCDQIYIRPNIQIYILSQIYFTSYTQRTMGHIWTTTSSAGSSELKKRLDMIELMISQICWYD